MLQDGWKLISTDIMKESAVRVQDCTRRMFCLPLRHPEVATNWKENVDMIDFCFDLVLQILHTKFMLLIAWCLRESGKRNNRQWGQNWQLWYKKVFSSIRRHWARLICEVLLCWIRKGACWQGTRVSAACLTSYSHWYVPCKFPHCRAALNKMSLLE